MNTTALKFEIIKKIMETEEKGFENKIYDIVSEYYPPQVTPENKETTTEKPEKDPIIAYKADGQPLTIKDLKAEILEIIDDTCKGVRPETHCRVKTRLKGILWL